jgi:hypothetical protein
MANGYDNGFTEDVQYGGGDSISYERRASPQRTKATRQLSTRDAPSSGERQGGNTFQSASEDIRKAYRTYLDREASQQDILDHLSNGQHFAPHNVQHAIGVIRNSEEAQRYREGQRTEEPTQAVTPSGGMPKRRGRAPSGYNQTKWDDDGPDGEHSVKYDAAAFLYGVTTAAEIQGIVDGDDFQERFPGARFDGIDSIDFKGALSDGNPVGVVDVLLRRSSHQEGSGGLWWDALGPGGAGGGDAPPGPGTPGPGQNREWTQPPGSRCSTHP